MNISNRNLTSEIVNVNKYQEILDRENEVTIDIALKVAKDIIYGVPKDEQDRIYYSLDRGKAILSSEEQCAGYMSWFAKKHIEKFAAAFEYLPKEICQNVIDIYDWGCGIGLASFALCDWYNKNFPKRRYSKKIRKIMLIEPSDVAIKWATYNTKRCFPEAKVSEVQKYFMKLEHEDFSSGGGPTLSGLHIFSNVLDIKEISEKMHVLVEKIKEYALGRTDYIILISPNYGDIKSKFKTFFNQLSQLETHDVEQILEIKEFSWSIECGDTANASGVIAVWKICSKNTYRTLEMTEKWRDLYNEVAVDETAGAEHQKLMDFVYSQLKELPDKDIGFRYKPNIYGITPDLVIMRKGFLPVFISINNRFSCEVDVDFMRPVENIRKELIKNNKELHSIESYKYIKVVAYNPEKNCIGSYVGPSDKTNNQPRYEWQTVIPWKSYGANSKKVVEAVRNLLRKKKCADIKINLDAKQQQLANSRLGRQKVVGCFGSGKTTVLVARAINAYHRTHSQVLILTYNISLRNHIEYTISQRMDADLTGKEFLVLNFHQFIKTRAMPFISDGNVIEFLGNGRAALNSLMAIKNDIPKYRTILVDECQDFKYEWLEILTNVFLSNHGEYVLFGDEKQNVYGRELESKKIKTNVPGAWNILSQCHRSSGRLLDFIMQFQSVMPQYEKDNISRFLMLDNSVVEYHLFTKDDIKCAVDFISQKMSSHNMLPGEITILSESHDFLRDLELNVRQNNVANQTERMFWSKEEMDKVKSGGNWRFKDERDLKLFFDGDQVERMKFSTIESFKGFESSCVFLFVESYIFRGDKNNRPMELIYTGITRAMKYLFVCNMGNKEMHSVFQKLI